MYCNQFFFLKLLQRAVANSERALIQTAPDHQAVDDGIPLASPVSPGARERRSKSRVKTKSET